MKEALKRIASELRYYNPLADKYKGEFIHKVWANEIDELLAQPDNTANLYEELRKIIDGGSESFTHEDAVQYLKDKLAQPAVAEPHKSKPLTDEQIATMWQQYNPLRGIASFARAIEAAHGIRPSDFKE